MKINNIAPDKHNYLQMVADIAHAPETLYYIGTLPTERRPTLAIVGTRRPTKYGVEVTTRFASALAGRGIVIVSGLALGVDALAHRSALEAGGTTLAVLANPLPRIQPTTNRQLGEQIVANGGAIISEHQEGDDYKFGIWSFPQRNRIVAGISDAILITEASARSGTMGTAMYALEQGKDVFVIPGNITSPMSAGCNALIKQGAIPVTDPEDIIAIMLPHTKSEQGKLPLGATEIEQQIIAELQAGVRDADEIQRHTTIAPIELSTALTMLEISGTVRSLGANQWTLR